MFAIVTKLDHDTWQIKTNVNDDHGPKTFHAHSELGLKGAIETLAYTFAWYCERFAPWDNQAGNLYLSFDNAEDYGNNVWNVADILWARTFRTNGFSAAYNL